MPAAAAPPPPSTATSSELRRLARRRVTMTVLVAFTTAALAAWEVRILGDDGVGPVDLILIALMTLTLPWLALGGWNAVIGMVIGLRRDPAAAVLPGLRQVSARGRVVAATAIVVPVRDEDPDALLRHLRATMASVDATGQGRAFSLHVLSDTGDPAIAAREADELTAWAQDEPGRIHYRRRSHNGGHKTGNMWEWLERCGQRYELMLVLDADSLMSGDAVLRLVRTMQALPEVGILQHLTTGLPNSSPFPRLFQLGMRHGMRAYSLGSAWWQGDCGPFWGHNAVVRIAPFMAHCRMPELPGRPPFGGRILSHDQVEAVLMRRAGWQVRLLVEEEGSYEVNPPTLIDFVQRDLRWGKGNLQYANLLPRLEAHRVGRVQLALSILMYLSAPAWLLFVLLVFGRAGLDGTGVLAAEMVEAPLLGVASAVEPWALFGTIAVLTMAPKLAGIAQACLRPGMAASYGGRPRMLGSAAIELLFSVVLTPLMISSQARVAMAMLGGRAIHWGAQLRSHRRVRWAEAVRSFWFELALGGGLIAVAALAAPALLPWALLAGGLLLAAAPFAIVTADARLGRWMVDAGIATTPDELRLSPLVVAAGHATAGPGKAGRADAAALAEA